MKTNYTLCSNDNRPCFSAPFLLVALGLALFLNVTEAFSATHLFDNLRAFGTRLDVGDPALNPTNSAGQITDGPKDIAVADLNGDGHPDFAVANKDSSVTVYFGDGHGSFGTPLHLHANAGELRGIVCADLTGDGKIDIAVGAPYDSKVFLFVNQGNGTFASVSALPAWYGARDLAAGDFDGDGLIDLAVAGTTNGVAHFHNLGGGSFEVVTNITTFAAHNISDFPQPAFYLKSFRPPSAARDELAVGRAQQDKVWVLAVDSSGRLAIQNTLSNVPVNALDIGPLLRPANDPAPDLVIAHHDRGVLEIHSTISTSGRFSQITNQQITIPGGPRNVRIVDLDGDGWNDLVVVQQSFNKVLTFRNLNGAFVPFSEAAVGASPREMDIGDFNSDGHPDVAVLNRQSSDVSILLTYPGVAGFAVPDNVYTVDGEVSGLEVRDFNGDGLADVIQFHRSSGEMSVRLANTNGLLGPPTFYPLGLRPMGKVVADVNNDGIDDMVTADFTPFVTVRLGLGHGDFGEAQKFFLPDEVPTSGRPPGMQLPSGRTAQLFSLEAADFDGDGNIDLAVGFWDCRLGFYRGHGDGTFTFTRAHVLFSEPRGQVAGDFDGDGDMDIVVASLYTQIAVIENRGDLLTTEQLTKTLRDDGVSNTSAIKAYDSNEDGDLDLLAVGSGGAKLFLGGPGMSFTDSGTTVGIPGQPASSVATGDFDGDGDIDLATTCAQLACISIALGDDTGSYLPAFTADVPSSRFLASGDIDGDGLPDLVGTGESLWVALSSRPSESVPPGLLPAARAVADRPVINELLALNTSLPLDADSGRNTDWVEIYNGATNPVSFAGWRLTLIRTNVAGITITNQFGFTNQFTPTNWVVVTNEFVFPQDSPLEAAGHRLLIFSDKVRTPYHTGFPLPGSGGTLCLINPQSAEVDRVDYPAQQANISFSRFRDGMPSFISCNFPTPGRANADSGPVPPTLDFTGVDLSAIQPDQPIRFFARATDDVGVMGVVLVWRRLDIPNSATNRLILSDDGMNEDGGFLDGVFSGVLRDGLPAGAEIEFYLECMDVSELVVTAPGNPAFATAGAPVTLYSLAVGALPPSLELSEVVADNGTGLRDEGNGTPDWIEFRNCGAQPVSLTGIGLAQKFFGNSGRMTFTNVTLVPGQHFVVYADNNTAQSSLHAPFKINKDGDELILTATGPNGSRMLVDSLRFGPQARDTAWSRLGCAGPWRKTAPTPRSGNIAGTWASLVQTNGTFLFGFPTVTGAAYTVQYSDSLTGPWSALSPIIGDGLEKTVNQPLGPKRFFRVRVQ